MLRLRELTSKNFELYTPVVMDVTHDSILIVDDDLLVRTALEESIKRQGYKVITAASGKEALEKMANHSLSVIVCDLKMPDLNGVQVLERALTLCPDAIRIVLTGHADLEMVTRAINVGQVSQFIAKPWEEPYLIQAIQTSIEKYALKKENSQLHQLILAQHQELAEAHASLQEDLLLGARIHENLLLGKIPKELSEFPVSATTIPSKDIDGDFFEFYLLAPGIMDIVFGDVMGKGVPAALVGTAVKTQLMRFVVPFIRGKTYDSDGRIWVEDLLSPQEILMHVHTELSKQLIDLEYFVCLFYGRFDLTKKLFSYVDCGSTKPIHFSAGEKSVKQIKGESFPLGAVEENSFVLNEVRIATDDLIVFYSDGVTEARSPEGVLYGVERLTNLIIVHSQENVETLLDIIKKDIIIFCQKSSFDDDLTIIIVKVPPFTKPLGGNMLTAKFSSDLGQLQAVRKFVHSCCQRIPGDGKTLSSQLQLAINEVFCNIVIHGYKDKRGGVVVIDCELQEEGILFKISDQADSFDPELLKGLDLSGKKEGGLGWYMIKEIADRLSYIEKQSSGGWNHLYIFKHYFLNEVDMEILHSNHDGVLILTPLGTNLDAKESPAFKTRVNDLISTENVHNVVFDLRNLQFIDSSGLGSFLSVLRHLHASGGELKLSGMSKPIRTMFELVSMHKIFEIFNTNDEAIRSFKSSSITG